MVSIWTPSCLRDPAVNKIHVKEFVPFDMEPPSISYKTCFLVTNLGAALTRVSSDKVAPTRLKHQEYERVRGGKKAQEALDLKPKFIKYMFANRSETQVMIWSDHSMSMQFLLHINKAYSTAIKWD